MTEFSKYFLIVFKAGFEVITKDSDLDMAGLIRGDTRFVRHVTDIALMQSDDVIELFCLGRERNASLRLRLTEALASVSPSCGICCQRRSVMNGMNGWSSASMRTRVYTRKIPG